MIVTIDSFEQYAGFILDVSRDPLFCDPHFAYDPGTLYGALQKRNEFAFAVMENGTIKGLFG